MSSGRSRVRFAAIAMSVALAALLAPLVTTSAQAAAPTTPSVTLIGASADAEIHVTSRGYYELHFPALMAAVDGPFELWAQRPSYFDPVGLSQIVRDGAGAIDQTLPVAGVPEPNLSRGLTGFVTTTLAKRNGTVLKTATRAFCPNSYSQERIDDTGPTTSRYPADCWASPFTRGSVWGIDTGWATQLPLSLGRTLDVAEGTYRLTISIAEPYRAAFGMAAEDAELTVPVTVVQGPAGGGHSAGGGRSALAAAQSSESATATSFPITEPPSSALPDIAALPAWGMSVSNRPKTGKSFLNFGATAWNAGPGILMVEGFRDPASTTMDAFQYFYDQTGAVVGKVAAGSLEYDGRAGHDHWHFRDFASYSLLDRDKVKVVDSGKEAFCLAPTDPIDLTVDNAEWRPWLTNLGTACGEEGSLWIREVLQVGWGDTYTQYRPGQSFDITDLPNGKYFVKVLANPDGVLRESDTSNNEALRRIYLRGKPGERFVEVPALGLIDSEGSSCGAFC